MNPHKVKNLTSMSGADRFDYFVRKVADFHAVWGLHNEGWATAATDEGAMTIAFWPEEDAALLCATSEWSGYTPKKIELSAFLEAWLPGMKRDKVSVAVFPIPGDKGVVITPDQMRDYLETESSQYE